MITLGQGINVACPACGKWGIAVVKGRTAQDGFTEYYMVCPSCSAEIIDEELSRQNRYLKKEQEIISQKQGMFLVVEGEPVPQGRPRFASVQGRFIHAYDPKKSVAYKDLIRWHVRSFMQRYPVFQTLKENIVMELDVYRPIPASFSNKKKELCERKELLPNTKPDTDNYVKTVQDAANGLVFKDDSAIVSILARKFYSLYPRIEVSFYELSPGKLAQNGK